MKVIREAFERARTDAGEIDRAIAAAEAFLAAHADHPVAMAYQGALHGMKADAVCLPWLKLRHANISASLLDGAYERQNVADAPAAGGVEPSGDSEEDLAGDLEILLLRGVTYTNFPPFLGRGTAARYSLEKAVGHPAFSRVSPAVRALTYAHLAVLCRRAHDDEQAGNFLASARAADLGAADRVWETL